jgi:hypothetical protein
LCSFDFGGFGDVDTPRHRAHSSKQHCILVRGKIWRTFVFRHRDWRSHWVFFGKGGPCFAMTLFYILLAWACLYLVVSKLPDDFRRRNIFCYLLDHLAGLLGFVTVVIACVIYWIMHILMF